MCPLLVMFQVSPSPALIFSGAGAELITARYPKSPSSALALAVKQAHWNVKGRNFIAVHELLDMLHNNLREQIDVMAERVQQLDGVALGTVEKVSGSTTLAEYPTDLTKAEDHIRALCDRYRDHGEKLRTAIDATDEAAKHGE